MFKLEKTRVSDNYNEGMRENEKIISKSHLLSRLQQIYLQDNSSPIEDADNVHPNIGN